MNTASQRVWIGGQDALRKDSFSNITDAKGILQQGWHRGLLLQLLQHGKGEGGTGQVLQQRVELNVER
jgi:hypothetical protein